MNGGIPEPRRIQEVNPSLRLVYAEIACFTSHRRDEEPVRYYCSRSPVTLTRSASEGGSQGITSLALRVSQECLISGCGPDQPEFLSPCPSPAGGEGFIRTGSKLHARPGSERR